MEYTFDHNTIYILTVPVYQPCLNPGFSVLSLFQPKFLAEEKWSIGLMQLLSLGQILVVYLKECFVVDITVILSFGPINKDFVLTSSFILVDLIRKKDKLSLLHSSGMA